MDEQEVTLDTAHRQTYESLVELSIPMSGADALVKQHNQIAEEQRLARKDRYALAKRLSDALSEIHDLKRSLNAVSGELVHEIHKRERVQDTLNEVFESSSWKLTAPMRCIASAVYAIVGRYKNPVAANSSMQQLAATDSVPASNGEYEAHTRAQAAYFGNCAKDPSKQRRHQISRLLTAHSDRRGVVLCPVAYDLSLKQRPDHIMAEFAKAGYLFVMLEYGGPYPFIQPTSENLYVSNMVEDFLGYFQDEPVTLYLHWPGFKYVADLCRAAFTIYDVLDDLTIFANYSEVMRCDHELLLHIANVCLFSSNRLYEANRAKVTNALLLENGVYPEDFLHGQRERCDVPPELYEMAASRRVVGYHGAISELLDFDLLDEMVRLHDVVLLFVGPVVAFEPQYNTEVQERMARLKTFGNFIHLGPKPYSELKHYLAWVDVGIVPFIVSEKTDPVSPLKLFEYLAAGKPVIATPTRTIREYEHAVIVASGIDFVDAVASGQWSNAYTAASAEVARMHAWPVLHAPLLRQVNARNVPRLIRPATRRAMKVDIVNVNFYDWAGETVYKGGAERYVYDLAVVLGGMGCEVRLLQNAWKPFEREFRGVKVVGVNASDNLDLEAMSSKYAEICADADLIIASPTELASSLGKSRRVISINHGIHWDGAANNLATFDRARYETLFRALRNSDRCVCVDTNFINWVRTYDWGLANTLSYVPNYVDQDSFRSNPKDFDAQELCVLLPRRLYEARGLYLTITAFDLLFSRRPDIRLVLCGQAVDRDAQAVKAFVARHPHKVTWIEYDMEDMHKAYVDSHIVLVPTMYSEGTSLSCIEALATHNAVIATNVGGLPNLIVDGYNGRLIRADYVELAAAIEELADDRAKLARLAAHGLDSSSAFAKTEWENRWREVIQSTLTVD
ncbi:glycosyltransferase [Paraburkholderia aromaticivorans]|uniref:Glycosyl transferase family 1 n=1 Tax=Paraburkholderia aromaticivorans TaxID=2026199 RepID=A0A248VRI7_9BURK|nr:glycosyltransferase [Paraburkholderia aromaticivorans]ASW01646.1 glycosyl transferase family 1 [Paraburkholderia aromaticivorans]